MSEKLAGKLEWQEMAETLGYEDEFNMWYDLYIANELNTGVLSKKLGVSRVTVCYRMDKLGIPRRGRGGANATGKIKTKLHLMDQRLIYSTSPYILAKMLRCSYEAVYSYRKIAKET